MLDAEYIKINRLFLLTCNLTEEMCTTKDSVIIVKGVWKNKEGVINSIV